jgi:hypothetical protein
MRGSQRGFSTLGAGIEGVQAHRCDGLERAYLASPSVYVGLLPLLSPACLSRNMR